jgi:hypothetical protein
MIVVKPEQVLAHTHDVLVVKYCGVVLEVGVDSSYELRNLGSHSSLHIELCKGGWGKTWLTNGSSLKLTTVQLPILTRR